MNKTARVPPTFKPSSRADLEARRKGVVARGPSGAVYRIRKVNLRRQVELGSLPTELRKIALASVRSQMNGGEVASELTEDDMDALNARRQAQRDEDDRLLLATVIEPKLTLDDLGTDELDDDPVVPAVDQEWLVAVARGTATRDGEGRSLWGPDPVTLIQVFQREHDCQPDCKHCAGVDEEFNEQIRRGLVR